MPLCTLSHHNDFVANNNVNLLLTCLLKLFIKKEFQLKS